MVYTNTDPIATHTVTTSVPDKKDSNQSGIDATLAAALEHARRMTTMFGIEGSETAIAWDIVEELQRARIRSAVAHPTTPRASFMQYCQENPDAPEARIYDS